MMEWLNDAHSWVAISFVIFCIAAWVLGRKPVVTKLDDRIARIRKDIETAESLKSEAETLLKRYLKNQKDAASEASRIVDNARKHAAEIQSTAQAALRETAERHERQLQDRLKRMEENTLNEIRAHAADLAVKATAELIAAHMDEKTNARLIDEAIKDLAKDAA